MHVAYFLFIYQLCLSSQILPLSLLCLSFHTPSTLQLSSRVPSSVFPPFFSPSVTRTNTGVIISGRLAVKVRYDKHAAVVINFE